ncbi:MAG: lipid-transfer protein [bacterium]|nr:lipid-transfer protein [bacterium]
MADPTWLRGRSAIVGIGSTAYGLRGEFTQRGELSLAAEAVAAACADAGIAPSDIDGWSSYSMDSTEPGDLAHAFGSRPVRLASMTHGGGGAAMGGAFLHAAMAVATGQADACVVYRSICQGKLPFGQAMAKAPRLPPAFSWAAPYGLMAPGQMFALAAVRHMHLYGTTEEHFCRIAVNAREMAANNPQARFREPLSADEYFSMPYIYEPMRRPDICMESDVAVAVVITSAERAADLDVDPVHIAAASIGAPQRYGQGLLGSYNMRDSDFASAGQRTVAADVYSKAGLGPADVDVAQIYDHFSPLVLMGLEDFGFCEAGEGGPFVADGGIGLNALPLNTAGGNLAEVYAHGMTQVTEAVRQLRGTAINQVADAEVALVVGGAGPTPTSALILTRGAP